MKAQAKAGLADYYRLTKPGIIYGNVITAAAGFCLAARGQIAPVSLAAVLAGVGLVIGSGCVVNNLIDRPLDRIMARTQHRALVSGLISVRQAATLAAGLGVFGFALLTIFTNRVTVLIGVVGWVFYVVMYSLLSKPRSVHGTLIGSVAGAVPPVAGYTSVTGQVDGGAWLLFIILTCWQMPHFYAIAMYRLKDYQAAGVPVLPVRRGIRQTKYQIVGYVAAFGLATAGLTWSGYTGQIFFLVMLALSLWWLKRALAGFRARNNQLWARGIFGFSINVLMTFSVLLAIDSFLP